MSQSLSQFFLSMCIKWTIRCSFIMWLFGCGWQRTMGAFLLVGRVLLVGLVLVGWAISLNLVAYPPVQGGVMVGWSEHEAKWLEHPTSEMDGSVLSRRRSRVDGGTEIDSLLRCRSTPINLAIPHVGQQMWDMRMLDTTNVKVFVENETSLLCISCTACQLCVFPKRKYKTSNAKSRHHLQIHDTTCEYKTPPANTRHEQWTPETNY